MPVCTTALRTATLAALLMFSANSMASGLLDLLHDNSNDSKTDTQVVQPPSATPIEPTAATHTDHGLATIIAQAISEETQPLRQRLRQTQQRLNAQAKDIAALKTRVDQLEQRIHRVKATDRAHSSKADPVDAKARPSDDTADSGVDETESSDKQDAIDDSEDEDSDAADGDDKQRPPAKPSDSGSKPSSHKAINHEAHDAERPVAQSAFRCSVDAQPNHQYDVFFQANGQPQLDGAQQAVQAAGLSDWFAASNLLRLYVGRYGPCRYAVRRRDDVHERTGLALQIAPVMARATHKPAQSQQASKNRSHRLPVKTAPFRIIGVEVRGTHRFLGVAPHHNTNLAHVAWLSPGEHFAGWQLLAIRSAAHRAVFDDGEHKVAVALPEND